METYSLMREFADSWMLLMLFMFFVGVCLWALRPGSKDTHKDIAGSIFRNESKPAAAPRTGLPDVSERIAQFKESRL